MLARARAIVRDDPLGHVEPLLGLCRRLEALEELRFELSLPLPHERSRREHEHPADEPTDGELLVDETRLDRLAEADFVRQDRAATHLAQHPLGHVDLVGQLLDRVRVEGDQPVEARHQRDPLRLAPQIVPGAVAGGRPELRGERRERAFIDRPGVLVGRAWRGRGGRGGRERRGGQIGHRRAARGSEPQYGIRAHRECCAASPETVCLD